MLTAVMQSLLARLGITKLKYSSIMVIYQTETESWRGFVVPFDVTFEAETKEEVIEVLRDMIESYVEGLKTYDNPDHLSMVPLSHPEDQKKWSSITIEVFNKLSENTAKVVGTNYYAEAQLPA